MGDIMANDCDPLIQDDHLFPRRPVNRPGQPRIGYRIGAFPEMLETMLRSIDRASELRGWTHRAPDDPGIALLHGAAILGDVLSFYQDRYANEAYLRTALWRESVGDLVRLTGYRLAPGLGGRGTLALMVTGSRPVVVPKGFPVKADIEGAASPADLMTDADVVSHPHLSKFPLFAPRSFAASLVAGTTVLELASVAGDTRASARQAAKIAKGDRLMLIGNPPAWGASAAAFATAQKRAQTVTVKEVRQVQDRTVITIETPLEEVWPTGATAYRLGRTFRHLGHAAPTRFTTAIPSSGGTITGAQQVTTGFLRHICTGHACQNTSFDDPLPETDWPLDTEVADLTTGQTLVLDMDVTLGTAQQRLTIVRRIAGLRGTSMAFAGQNTATSLVTLDSGPIASTLSHEADIRSVRLHEATSPALGLRPVAVSSTGGFSSGTAALYMLATQAQAREIAARRVMLWNESDGRTEVLTCVNDAAQFLAPVGEEDEPRMWALSFTAPPKLFTRADFPEEGGNVTALANLVEVSEGRAMPPEVLGNGDGGQVFQTFRLPKPVTHLLDATATPPWTPQLEVFVANRLWARVDSLFGQPPHATVYVLREDAEGNHHIQFGDGRTGARLPTGVGNVAVAWRTGHGTNGPMKPQTNPTGSTRITGLSTLAMPGGLSGAALREETELAREAAPGKVQGLDRLVSLRDYETELLAIPGVERVRADWAIRDGVPMVVLTVLMARGREAEYAAVATAIGQAQRARGPNRFALAVEPARRRVVFIDLRYGLDPHFRDADVAAAISARLAPLDDPAAARDGLFAARMRTLGGREYPSRIEAAVQTVPGVTFAEVTALGILPDAETALPTPRPLAALLTPAAHELLCLTRGTLVLTAAAPDSPGGTA